MARLSIDKEHLDNIGDALRVHFGENLKEGELTHQEGSPLILSANYREFGTSTSDYETYLLPEHFVRTVQVHGAARLKLDLSYRTDTGDYLWVAEGAHRDVNDNAGRKLEFSLYEGIYCSKCQSENVEATGVFRPLYWEREDDPNNKEYVYTDQLHVCQDCGAIGYTYSWWPDVGPIYYGMQDADGYTTIFPSRGELYRTVESFEFAGDTFTYACETVKDKTYTTGYYGHLYAYDADGNELTSYDITRGRVPNTYAPGEIAHAVSKLNNYPDAREVGF